MWRITLQRAGYFVMEWLYEHKSRACFKEKYKPSSLYILGISSAASVMGSNPTFS